MIGLYSLVGITGFQFIYMFYLDRLDRERKGVVELEHRCKDLSARLSAAERRIATQNQIIEGFEIDHDEAEEAWADILEES